MTTTDSLVSDLYAAASGRVPWATALGNIADFLDLWLVQVLSVDKRNGSLLFNAYGGKDVNPEVSLDYVRFYNTIDPRVAPALALSADQWLYSNEHHDKAFVATNPFYQDFLIPNGGGHLAGTKILESEDALYLLAMVGHHGQTAPSAVQTPFLHQLKHHFSEAFRNLAHLREAYAELGVARELLSQFDYPMFLVDEARGLCHRNDLGSAMISKGDVIADQGGYLVFRNKSDDNQLAEAINNLHMQGDLVVPSLQRRAIPMHKADGSPLMAFVSAVAPSQTMGVFGTTQRVLIVLHDPSVNRSRMDPFVLAECFDLTPAEARVAVRIAQGSSAKEIAQETGAALPTVRSHLQRIMEKTGVNRQSDLIRILLALPARLSS